MRTCQGLLWPLVRSCNLIEDMSYSDVKGMDFLNASLNAVWEEGRHSRMML